MLYWFNNKVNNRTSFLYISLNRGHTRASHFFGTQFWAHSYDLMTDSNSNHPISDSRGKFEHKIGLWRVAMWWKGIGGAAGLFTRNGKAETLHNSRDDNNQRNMQTKEWARTQAQRGQGYDYFIRWDVSCCMATHDFLSIHMHLEETTEGLWIWAKIDLSNRGIDVTIYLSS